MCRVQVTGEPLVLVYSRASQALCSAEERRRVTCPHRRSACVGIDVPVACREEPPWKRLRLRSDGCSPPAQPSGLPLRELRVPVSPRATSGSPDLPTIGSQSHAPSAALRSFYQAQPPV